MKHKSTRVTAYSDIWEAAQRGGGHQPLPCKGTLYGLYFPDAQMLPCWQALNCQHLQLLDCNTISGLGRGSIHSM